MLRFIYSYSKGNLSNKNNDIIIIIIIEKWLLDLAALEERRKRGSLSKLGQERMSYKASIGGSIWLSLSSISTWSDAMARSRLDSLLAAGLRRFDAKGAWSNLFSAVGGPLVGSALRLYARSGLDASGSKRASGPEEVHVLNVFSRQKLSPN